MTIEEELKQVTDELANQKHFNHTLRKRLMYEQEWKLKDAISYEEIMKYFINYFLTSEYETYLKYNGDKISSIFKEYNFNISPHVRGLSSIFPDFCNEFLSGLKKDEDRTHECLRKLHHFISSEYGRSIFNEE